MVATAFVQQLADDGCTCAGVCVCVCVCACACACVCVRACPHPVRFYEADLHTDRLAANEERSVAWNYRNLELCPAEVLPGFAMHQTDRDPTVLQHDQRSNNHSRARDYDLLGSRYSILSSIGTAGLNNVINMLPARDEQEFSNLPQEDIDFVHGWMNWTDSHVEWIRQTKTITEQPSGEL